MGLIDSTNRIERALLTAKQEKALERAEKKQQQAIKARDKVDKEVARDVVVEALEKELCNLFEMLGYNGAELYLKSLEAREKITARVASNELELKTALSIYDKTKNAVTKRYKAQEEYKTAQAMAAQAVEAEKQAKKARFNDVCKAIAQFIYNIIIGVFKIIGFFLLIVMGFTKFVFAVQPQQKRRYR